MRSIFSAPARLTLTLCRRCRCIHCWRGRKRAGDVRTCSDLVVAADLLDATPLVLTGNTESVYFACNVDLKKDGPTVVEIPPQVLGMANDAYFRYIIDFGMVGPDQGQGGKYLLLPPDYEGDVPEGYFVARSRTYKVWVMARAGQQISGTGRAGHPMVWRTLCGLSVKGWLQKAQYHQCRQLYRQIPPTPMISSTLSISTR